MAAFGGALGSADFGSLNPDTTSTPPIPTEQQPTPQPAQGLAAALARRKKKGLVGPTVRTPSTLAAAISKSKRARPGASKLG